QERLAAAQDGYRQLVFVTGEAGIGKTTVVEAFLTQVTSSDRYWVGYGSCIEHHGSGMAYHPILEALNRLCRSSDGEELKRILQEHAPTWLVQMPTLIPESVLDALRRRTEGATQERLFRELANAVEVLTVETPFILWLEDLHWSDSATIELLSSLVHRQERAKLLVICLYRPVDAIIRNHPVHKLRQEFHELPLSLLSPDPLDD